MENRLHCAFFRRNFLLLLLSLFFFSNGVLTAASLGQFMLERWSI